MIRTLAFEQHDIELLRPFAFRHDRPRSCILFAPCPLESLGDERQRQSVVDLFISKGNVEAQPDFAAEDPNNLLIGQPDGTFVEGAEAAGIVAFERSRGAALVDLDLDGMLDLVVVNRRENVRIYRNVGSGDAEQPEAMGNWIQVRLAQPAPNPDAIGAWLEVRAGDDTSVHEVTVGGGHASGELGWLHTGLGDATGADVRVQWPDGETGPWITVAANRFVTIERGGSEAVSWSPGESSGG